MLGKKNIITPSTVTWLTMLIRAFVVVIITPLIINNYKSGDMISTWILYLTIYNFILLFDAGFTPTFSRYFAYCSKNNESYNGISKADLISFQHKTYFILALIGVLVTTIVMYLCDLSFGLEGVGFILALGANLYYGKYVSILEGSGKLLVSRLIILLQVIIQLVVVLMLFILEFKLMYLLVGYYLPIVLVLLIFHKASKECYKHNSSRHSGNNVCSAIKSQSFKTAFSLLSTIGVIQAITILYSQGNNTVEATSVLYSMMLVRQLANFSQVPFYTRLPEMASLFSEGKIETLNIIAKKSFFYSLSLLVLFGITTLFVNNVFSILDFEFSIPLTGISIWLGLVFAFTLERGLAIFQHYLAARDIVIWHRTGPMFGVFVILGMYTFNETYLHQYSIPLSIAIASLFSFIYIWYYLNNSEKFNS